MRVFPSICNKYKGNEVLAHVYVAGTRERFAGEIIPVEATQSQTQDNDEANHGAGLAIDMDYSTTNNAVGKNGGNPWLKISLGKVYCVQRVERQQADGSIRQTWICTETGCTCTGTYCQYFTMIVSTEGQITTTSPNPECSYGNTVTYQRMQNTKGASAYEMVVIGKEATLILNPGKS